MSAPIKYSERYIITDREMNDRAGLPSQILREAEASMIGRLARSVALAGGKFDGWPMIELVHEYDLRDNAIVLVATVVKK